MEEPISLRGHGLGFGFYQKIVTFRMNRMKGQNSIVVQVLIGFQGKFLCTDPIVRVAMKWR
jgi:hypothetical protein